MNIFRLLFSFNGRLNRQGFWIGFGINFLLLFFLANFWKMPSASDALSLLPLLFVGYSLAAVVTKRLHDRNRSAKALFMVLVPVFCYGISLSAQGIMQFLLGVAMPVFIGTILFIEWGVFKSFPEENQYGKQGLSLQWK
ncbi:DUF805 domain-containing protein [Bibersteinia trehalosi]|uniref:DUF805 domain-containing protein n=1 Tax=Bibersteinia trehalosi TaxID=47735 RepID=UPI00104D7ADA|nr:DUF805 domain-containing protein [Bibersteinia trehalosi]